MNTERILPKNWKPIDGASKYALSPNNVIHHLDTGKPVRRVWRGLCYRSQVYDDEGNIRTVNHNTLTVAKYELPDEDMVIIHDYPDYKVTPYGAVWKYRNTGKRYRNNPFLISVKDIGDTEYVRLKTEDGRAHWVRMEHIMEDAYPDD